MKKPAAVVATAVLVLLLAAGAALAASAKVMQVDGEKVTVSAKGTALKTGEAVVLRAGDDYVSGTVSSVSGDTMVVVLKRKASFLQEGKSVVVEKKGSAALQGC